MLSGDKPRAWHAAPPKPKSHVCAVWTRRLFKALAFVLAILSANLLTNWLDDYLVGYRGQYDPVLFTLGAMGIVVVVFTPLFAWLDAGAERMAQAFLRTGKRVAGRFLGMLLAFLIAFYGLFWLYGRWWLQRDLNPLVWERITTWLRGIG